MNELKFNPRRCATLPCLLAGVGSLLFHLSASAQGDAIPVADRANYRSDCLRVITNIKNAPKDASLLYVVSQSDDGKDLNVVKGETRFLNFFCKPSEEGPKAELTKISVDNVIASGARRRGLVYGMLLTPYKYYPHSHQLESATSIGPYVGARTEYTQGALTLVATAAMGNVMGTSTDATGATKQVSLTAFSLAGGAIFEISKSKNPFRLGVLVGQDRVRPGTGVTYENNGKTWVALQLGYDFTDY